ncbi:E3 SUMO-protein ligase PIAS2-like [Rhipicephalus sanguineus]|nr:E3 SUMO-protein ligase PIAS2-like [Rhipicephalus sanguineus]
MSDLEEYRQMILNFRVSELQVLLGFAGRNKSGKKQELQLRALELLRGHSTPILMKIRDLHKLVQPSISAPRRTRSSWQPASDTG